MNVFVTGGTGYVGGEIVRALLSEGHAPTLLVRSSSIPKIPASLRSRLEIVPGEIKQPETYDRQLRRCEAIIHLVGIIREYPQKGITFQDIHVEATRSIVTAAERTDVRRFLHMSALGARRDAIAGYHRSKYEAEQILRNSSLDWTIFRPSLIVGGEGGGHDNFVTTLRDLLTMMPFFVPVMGSGNYRFQPVAVDNLAMGFVRALAEPKSILQIYDVAWSEVYSFNDMLDMVAEKAKRKKVKIHQPMWLMKILARCFGRYAFFPVSFDQIIMMEEESVTDLWRQFFGDFNITPSSIRDIVGEAKFNVNKE
ncbi:MAG: NAD(P)H-binding protein [Ignavibacteriales bacterium]|nr:NAD(P)H-binding protein [Ignavibacteriales bacterium]